jgi:histidine ammonia-lyase
VQQIVATELLIAAQAITLSEPHLPPAQFPLGIGSAAAYHVLRAAIPAALDGDRWLHADLAVALDLVRTGRIIGAVAPAIASAAP